VIAAASATRIEGRAGQVPALIMKQPGPIDRSRDGDTGVESSASTAGVDSGSDMEGRLALPVECTVSEEQLLPPPGELSDGVVALDLREITPAIPAERFVPAYHFTIVRIASRDAVGLLSLRVGSSVWLERYAGHIGYAIAEQHRGRRYASRALALVAPLAWRCGIVPVWITCNPDNAASCRTCELAGAEFIETVSLPPGNDMYARGDRFKSRYRLAPRQEA
jgi:predicted acetyltransferase